jgi:hypothetical protein
LFLGRSPVCLSFLLGAIASAVGSKPRNTRLLRPTAAGHVERLDLVLSGKGHQSLTGTLVATALAEVQPRLAMLPRKVGRALTSAGQLSGNRKDDRAVRVADVPFGALEVGR